MASRHQNGSCVLPFHRGLTVQARFVQQVTTLAILDLYHPKVRIKLALAGDGRLDILVRALGQGDPNAIPGKDVDTALKGFRRAVQRVLLDDHCAGIVITVDHDEGRDILQAKALDVGMDPELCRQARHLYSPFAVGIIQTDGRIAFRLVQPAGADLDLKEQVHFAIQELL